MSEPRKRPMSEAMPGDRVWHLPTKSPWMVVQQFYKDKRALCKGPRGRNCTFTWDVLEMI